MYCPAISRGLSLGARCLAALVLAGASALAFSNVESAADMLHRAEAIMTSNPAEYDAVLQRLEREELSADQRSYLQYLKGFRAAYRGDYATAVPLLDEVAERAADPTLRFRAALTEVNILGIGHHYVEAFNRLSQVLDQLPNITDAVAREKALGVAAQLYSEAGEYDLAIEYADKLWQQEPRGRNGCVASLLKLGALFHKDPSSTLAKPLQDGVAMCTAADELLYANAIRYYAARVGLREGQPKRAIGLLNEHYAEAVGTRYPPLLAAIDSVLAQGYRDTGNLVEANRYALSVVSKVRQSDYPESLVFAYEVLYQVAEKQGDLPAALAYHKKYMEADKGYLTTTSAMALAYQTVKQQVLAKKLQIDTLAKENKILQLQQALSEKAVEASRLWIILLLLLLGSIGFVAYRIKRSQLKFMKLARRDGLTGIFNRQHFVNEAERLLQYCCKSNRDACLVLLDLDHFKQVNDTHGHAVGDRVLKRAVAACQAHLRSTDLFGRLGGEEFGMLLPECGAEQALARVEQMRLAIAAVSIGENGTVVSVSASFGVASAAASGYELRQLMTDADDALYEAKREGRNRISLSANCGAQLSLV